MPFGLSLSTVKIIAIAIVVAVILGLFGMLKLRTSQRDEARAETKAAIAQRDEAIAANEGLARQVESMTADAAAAAVRAEADHAAAAGRQAAADKDLTRFQSEIDHGAAKTDDVESPAIGAWFERLRRAGGNGADDRAPAAP